MSTDLNLTLKVTASTQGVVAAVGNVNRSLESMAAAGKKAAADLGVLKTIEISRVFVSTVTNAANAFQSLVAGAASSVASIDDLSRRTGVSTTALQAYQFAADQSGVSIETFGKSLQKLTINLGEAQNGNANAIKSFAELGLSVEELSQLSPQVAFEKVAAAIAELPNPAQQAAAAVSLFGKSGIDLVPVFQEGAQFLERMRLEAERLGTVLSAEQVGNLAALDDSIAKVAASFKALTARVVAELAPALTAAAQQFAEFLGSIDAREVAQSLSGDLKNLIDSLREFTGIGAALSSVLSGVVGFITVLVQQVQYLTDNFRGAVLGATAVVAAFVVWRVSAISATAATVGLAAATRGLLASTGVGLLITLLGTLGGAFIESKIKAMAGLNETKQAAAEAADAVAEITEAVRAATTASVALQDQFEETFKAPARVTKTDLVQDVVTEAGAAFKKLAKDIGDLDAVPANLLGAIQDLETNIRLINTGRLNIADPEAFIQKSAKKVLALVQQTADAREAERKKVQGVVDAVRKAQEFDKQLAEDKKRRIEDLSRRELEAQGEIKRRADGFERDRLRGLSARLNEPLKISDIRTDAGISQFISLAMGREDPAVEEARRQTKELEAMNRKLDELRAEKVEIMGGA